MPKQSLGSLATEVSRLSKSGLVYQRQIRTAATLSSILYYIQHWSGNIVQPTY